MWANILTQGVAGLAGGAANAYSQSYQWGQMQNWQQATFEQQKKMLMLQNENYQKNLIMRSQLSGAHVPSSILRMHGGALTRANSNTDAIQHPQFDLRTGARINYPQHGAGQAFIAAETNNNSDHASIGDALDLQSNDSFHTASSNPSFHTADSDQFHSVQSDSDSFKSISPEAFNDTMPGAQAHQTLDALAVGVGKATKALQPKPKNSSTSSVGSSVLGMSTFPELATKS